MVILCNGMVRSGSTLQFNLIRLLVEHAGKGIGQEAVRRLTGGHVDRERLADDPLMFVFKSHSLGEFRIEEFHDRMAQGHVYVCYTYRDLRDVAVSLMYNRNWRLDDCLDLLDKAVENDREVRALPHQDRVLIQQYERIVLDLPRTAQEIAEFLGIETDAMTIAQIASQCTIDRAEEIARKTREKYEQLVRALWRVDPPKAAKLTKDAQQEEFVLVDRTSMIHHNHISPHRGKSGVWRREFSDDEVAFFHDRYGNWLAERGYLNETEREG